ncbi:type VI secretion system amidase effector protein Tae4 [Phytopseudomonas dryadis]|uniref:Type VI secretion system amidase effector protein Tae4 n=1 Tax=Phytopseudomonas dryadis TaxID=2487520 RepID=A0A4Q9R8P1_9GAMM|nr:MULTISPECIES: type VI secretion system amidase effector protein Tae4 [Pseudomonas]TBU96091.1 hypothetical protein DNK44_04865 [Pseudomonas dryadis]TBV01096.1 hypothetical protein DNK34_21815 [Pseudomonas dryadis]TBV13806.1 hypothetical protein DNK41_21505 [Pseudomonas sp. FRB 230]
MAKPAFINLWNGYPTTQSPCDGPWDNQCAIRLSMALNTERSIRVNRHTYSEPKCAHEHARGAESLANWLWRHHLGRPRIFTDGAEAKRNLNGANGIIFFKNCFTRSGETQATGDHIDLWNKGFTKGFRDDANRAEQVWFWELT